MGGLIGLDYLLSSRPSPDIAVLSAPALQVGNAGLRSITPPLSSLFPRTPISTGIKRKHLSRDPQVGEAYFTDRLVYRGITSRLGQHILAAIERVHDRLVRLSVPHPGDPRRG